MSVGGIENVIEVFFDGNYMNEWKEFININSKYFHKENKEYDHKHYEIYEEFNNLVENQLINCCERVGYSSNSFFHECKDILNDTKNKNSTKYEFINIFCILVIASTEFELFCDLMKDINKQKYYFQIFESWKKTLKTYKK